MKSVMAYGYAFLTSVTTEHVLHKHTGEGGSVKSVMAYGYAFLTSVTTEHVLENTLMKGAV